MAMLPQGGFDPTLHEASTDSEPIPAGRYTAMIVNSEMKPTKNHTGQYLKLEFEIYDGPFKGRKVFTNLNLINSNQQTVQIAQKDLTAICEAVGIHQRIQDSSHLHNIPLEIRVTVKQEQGYEPQNNVKGFRALNSAGVHPPATPAYQPPAYQQALAGQPPAAPAPHQPAPAPQQAYQPPPATAPVQQTYQQPPAAAPPPAAPNGGPAPWEQPGVQR